MYGGCAEIPLPWFSSREVNLRASVARPASSCTFLEEVCKPHILFSHTEEIQIFVFPECNCLERLTCERADSNTGNYKPCFGKHVSLYAHIHTCVCVPKTEFPEKDIENEWQVNFYTFK